MKKEDFPEEAWGDPPEGAAPRDAEWLGEWVRTVAWECGAGDAEREYLCWFREYLEHDGHEECCHHTWPVFVEVKLRVNEEG